MTDSAASGTGPAPRDPTPNPIMVDVTRGSYVESRHRGAACVVDQDGTIVYRWGDIKSPVYPRSAIKLLQALPFIETGAADAMKASAEELALACASHNGEGTHVMVAQRWLERLGLSADNLVCAAHEPMRKTAADALMVSGHRPNQLHNNCSGKHLAMLATALANNEPIEGYWLQDHPVQQRVRRTIEQLTEQPLREAPMGIDGCGLPTWGISIEALARSMAKIADPRRLSVARQSAIRRLRLAIARHPFLTAGTERFDSALIKQLSRILYVKTGAEGVYMASVSEFGLGIALKIDDGATRAAEVAMAALLRYLEVIEDDDWALLHKYVAPKVLCRDGRPVGEIRPADNWPASSR